MAKCAPNSAWSVSPRTPPGARTSCPASGSEPAPPRTPCRGWIVEAVDTVDTQVASAEPRQERAKWPSAANVANCASRSGVDVAATDTPALPTDEQITDVADVQAAAAEQQEEQGEGQRRSPAVPRAISASKGNVASASTKRLVASVKTKHKVKCS